MLENTYYIYKTSVTDKYISPVQAALLVKPGIRIVSYISGILVVSMSIGVIDGISVAQGDLLLVDCFIGPAAIYNGIYNFIDEYTIKRVSSVDFTIGFFTSVNYGVVNSGKIFKWNKQEVFSLDVTDIHFVEFNANVWKSDTSNDLAVWRKFSNFTPIISASFNREDIATVSNLAPPNKNRQINGDYSYMVEGFWNFTVKKFESPQKLVVYPRASLIDSVWTYIPNSRDIHIHARLLKGDTIIEAYKLIPAGNLTPIELCAIEVDSIIYLSVAKGNDMKSVRVATDVSSIGSAADIDCDSFEDNVIVTHNDVTQVNGVTLVNGDRLLIKNFTSGDAKYNGVYVYSNVGNLKRRLSRANDMNENIEMINGMTVRVKEGDQRGFYSLNCSDEPIVLNISEMSFEISIPTVPDALKPPAYGAPVGDKLVIRSI